MTGQEARGEEGKQEEETPVPLSLSSFVFGVRGKSNIFRLVHVPSLTRPTLDMNGCTGTAEDLHSGCR